MLEKKEEKKEVLDVKRYALMVDLMATRDELCPRLRFDLAGDLIGQSFFSVRVEVTRRRRRTSEYKWELYGEVEVMWLLISIQVMRMLNNILCPLIGPVSNAL